MTADDDLMKLYSQRILALAADIPHDRAAGGAAGDRAQALAALRLDGHGGPATRGTAGSRPSART